MLKNAQAQTKTAKKLAKVIKRSDCWRSKDEEETASRAGVMRMLRVVPCRGARVLSAYSARARDALWQVRANYVRNVIVGGLLTSLTVPCTETYMLCIPNFGIIFGIWRQESKM